MEPIDSFKEHKITRLEKNFLHMRKEGTRVYSCDMYLSSGGHLVVVGDIGPMIFATFHGTHDIKNAVRWIGEDKEVSNYTIEKASIGMGSRESLTELDTGTLAKDVEDLWERLEEEDYDINPNDFRKYCCRIGETDVEGLPTEKYRNLITEFLYDEGVNHAHEWTEDLGVRPSSALLFCHAAVRKAHLLLREVHDG